MRRLCPLISINLLVISSLLAGCVSVPPEAPELSAELGSRLSAIEDSHIALLHQFMDEKRRQIDDFVVNTWTPVFAEEIFESDVVSAVWDQVVQSGDPQERVELLVQLGPRLQARINQERMAMISPIDEIERELERRLRSEYRQARAVNNSITSFLASAVKVAETRDRLLDMAGIEKDEVRNAIIEADEAVATLVDRRNTARDRVNGFKKAIGDLKKKLR